MAILTPEQKAANEQAAEEKRKWIPMLTAVHTSAKSVKEKGLTPNKFLFNKNQYDTMEMVAVDRRFAYQIVFGRTEKVPEGVETDVKCYTDAPIENNPVYSALVAKYGDKVKVGYETLVFLPQLDCFAIFPTKTYARDLNEMIETAGYGVIEVTPDIHCPSWSSFGSDLYLWKCELTGGEIDPTGHATYEKELAIFKAC